MAKITRKSLSTQLVRILQRNAPVRSYPTGRHGASPYPGNLKQNGISYSEDGTDKVVVEVGGAHAPYAVYTETRSRKKGWQVQSGQEYLSRLISLGGKMK